MAFIRAGIRLGFGAACGGNGWGFLVSCPSLCVNFLGDCCKRVRDSCGADDGIGMDLSQLG